MPLTRARIFIGTLYNWTPPAELPAGLSFFGGQQEICPTTQRSHHQVIAYCKETRRTAWLVTNIGAGHWEPTKSAAADSYCFKEDTRVPGTQFELGTRPIKRNSAKDWELVKQLAKSGDLDSIPADIFVLHYRSLKSIASDYATVLGCEKRVSVFWGRTGTGKSRRAWEEAGLDAYGKDPRTKWWCGYRGETHVVIDEFRGDIDIAHMLRWLDRYPVRVETKGSSVPLRATHMFITSNVDPNNWYSMIDEETRAAFTRRLNIVEHFE